MTALAFGQEPGNNLDKSLYEFLQEFPDAVNTGPIEGGGDLWIFTDEDNYYDYTFYYTIKDGYVDSESLGVTSKGIIPNADYFFFITTVKTFYSNHNWRFCDVDASILRAASIFAAEYRLVWADKFTAEFYYSDFMVYFQYRPDSKITYISYFKQ